MISDWIAIFGTPEILMGDKDSIFDGGIFQDFHTSRNIISQTVIQGIIKVYGATERRRGLFRTIIDHVVGGRKPKKFEQ